MREVRSMLPLGYSDFRQLREAGLYYVDKTAFVAELLAYPAQVVLLPRPRRFGKTLNLSTLRWFFEKGDDDRAPLFAGLHVMEAGGETLRHFQRYPVLSLSFKDVKPSTYDDAVASIARIVSAACRAHWARLERVATLPGERATLEQLAAGTAPRAVLEGSLLLLTEWLERAAGERCLVLVDEYDAPVHAGFTSGYYDAIVTFFRSFLSAGLKDNPHLFRGVLSGILRVAKEGIFSGLNNLRVSSLLERSFSRSFGFTEAEVGALLDATGSGAELETARAWYDGYRFAGETIYNPWSVLNFAATPEPGPRPYWVSTSSDEVLRDVILQRGGNLLRELAALLNGETIRQHVDEHLALRDLLTLDRPSAAWSLLLFSGYLTATSAVTSAAGWEVELAIPNREARLVFEQSITSWAEGAGAGSKTRLRDLTRAMLAGDPELMADSLSELVLRTLSYHDVAGAEPERVYQAFVLGLLVELTSTHVVESNREAGHGRVDVLVTPRSPNEPGVVLELKRVASGESVERALEAALLQIEEKKYVEALRARGADPVLAYGVVFDGKRTYVTA